jgi:hypothetical protein
MHRVFERHRPIGCVGTSRMTCPDAPTRTVAEIIRANVLTRFNFLLGSLLAVILFVGPLQDALFGLVLVANTVVGIVQEVGAKRTLERLAVISAPMARVVRHGRPQDVHVQQVVLDDVLQASAGDQVVVDGQVLDATAAELDESLLTGESSKRPGDEVLSGSFVAAGRLTYRATRVGREAYATQLAEEARRFTLARSELRAGVDRIITLVTWLLVPTAILLLASQFRAQGVEAALRGAVAGMVHMVPEGLVLMESLAFAVSVVHLGWRNVLVQELPAVETLARVDVLCFDRNDHRRQPGRDPDGAAGRTRRHRRSPPTCQPPWVPWRPRTPHPMPRCGRSPPRGRRRPVGRRPPPCRSRPRASGALPSSAVRVPGSSAPRRSSSPDPPTEPGSCARPRPWPPPATGSCCWGPRQHE